MCLFISVRVLLKTLVSRVFWVNLNFIHGFKTKLQNKTCTQPIEQEQPPAKQKGGPESLSRCSVNNRRVLPIRLDLFKNKTDTALSLLTDEYISRAFARRDRWMDSARMRVYINTKSFGFLVYFTARRSTLGGWQSDEWGCEMTSVTRGFWQGTVTAAWFVTPRRTVYWAIKIVRLAEELRFHSETFILLATKYFRLWESRDWLAFTMFTFLMRFRRFILKQF